MKKIFLFAIFGFALSLLLIPFISSALGPDLINSGSWVFDNPPWSQSGNDFIVSAIADDFGFDLSQSVSTVASPKEYQLTYEIVEVIALNMQIDVTFAGNSIEMIADGDSGLRSFNITASSSADLDFHLDVVGGEDFMDAQIDNIVVREILPEPTSCVVDGVVSVDCSTTEDENIIGNVSVQGAVWSIQGAVVNING